MTHSATCRGRIRIEELFGLPTIPIIRPSWRGDRAAFYWDRTGRFELYVIDLKTRELRQVSNGQVPRHIRSDFVWTRDDDSIIFARDNDGDERHDLFRITLDSGDVTRLNHDPKTEDHPIEVAPDNRRLAVASNRAGQMNVFALDLATLEWRQLTRFSNPAYPVRWSPSGEWLAFITNESSDLKNADGYVMRADGSEIRRVFRVREESKDFIADWHPDGRRLAVTSDASGVIRPGVLHLESGEVRWYGREGIIESARRFSRDGRWLIALRNLDATLAPVVYDLETGAERALRLPPGVTAGMDFVLEDTRLLVYHAASNRPAELLLYDLATDTHEVLVPPEYGSMDSSWFVTDEHVWYPTFDERQVPALLYTPSHIAPGEWLPALVHVHGGPTDQFFRDFNATAQFLVDRGYVVLAPNIRGSTGYGTEWRDLNIRDWGGGDLEDVAAGVDFLKRQPYVDPERIGIFGRSFGGYMTFMAAVKKPDLFKVGVPMVGATDMHLLYEETVEHSRYYLRQMMGDPVQNHALWRARSAITHADGLKAKLLILHGINDPRCPVSQARVFRERLLALGKREGTDPDADFEYHEFTDEGHGPSGDIRGRIRTFSLLADFVERRL